MRPNPDDFFPSPILPHKAFLIRLLSMWRLRRQKEIHAKELRIWSQANGDGGNWLDA